MVSHKLPTPCRIIEDSTTLVIYLNSRGTI